MNEIAPVEITLHIRASPQEVFGYWTDPDRYVRWMGTEATLEPKPGGTYLLRMSDGMSNAGTFIEVRAPNLIIFTWGFADAEAAQHTLHEPGVASGGNPMPPGSTRVTVRLDEADGGTRLTLRHEDLPSPELREGHHIAWNVYLPRLAIRAEGGDPGADPHS
jgi:uncharacterized protein YndB with AHSA1/START domain